ncbi:Protein bcp1 [Serendipita indica DSM 11827]|nr:Protein bcp1 [Serendipita indica DSM 11827]
MPKRKTLQEDKAPESDSDVSIVDVDFDFCDFRPQTDYIAIKRLLQQLFHTDASLFHLGAIADLVLSQDDVGSTVKTDGVDSDPLAFLAVINLHEHNNHPELGVLRDYLLSKLSANPDFQKTVSTLLESDDSGHHLGLVLGERVYNMPPQVMPPSYKMLQDEIQWAIEDNKPYRFSHLLILSRVFKLDDSEEESIPPSKKRKTAQTSSTRSAGVVHSFHPEDSCIQK